MNLDNPESSALKLSLKVLRHGHALMIFPEGGRSPEKRPMAFKEGAAHLALKTGATILPVAIHGGERVWGPKMSLPLPRKVRVEYLDPIKPEQFEGTAEALTDQIRRAIVQSLGA